MERADDGGSNKHRGASAPREFDIRVPHEHIHLDGTLSAKSIVATRVLGRIATILPPQGDFRQLYARNLTLYGVFLTRERRRLEALGRLIERGQLRPLVDAVLPLEQVAEAHRRLDTGHGRGKVVLQVSNE